MALARFLNSISVKRAIFSVHQKIRWDSYHTCASPFTDNAIGELKVVSQGNGRCICELHVTKKHLNMKGAVHGGCISTLVDFVSSKARFSTEEPKGASVDVTVSFLAPAVEGDDIIIEAETIKAGKRLTFLETKLYKKGDRSIIATGKHTICT